MGKSKYTVGLSLLALTFMLLLFTSPISASNMIGSTLTTDTLDDDVNIEIAHVVGGLGTATYTTVFEFGGHDGSNMPVDDDAAGLTEAFGWYFAYANQGDFATYLNRLPMDIPDGASFVVVYPDAVSGTILKAATAAAYFDTEYGISLELAYFNTGAFDIYIFTTADDIYSDVVADVAAIDADGFNTLIDPAVVTAAPVSWAVYGARDLGSYRVGMHGVGWVDPAGLTIAGDVYTLSSDHIFGADVVPAATPSFGLSRLYYSFPYPISPVTDGITPDTSNPLPHVTGQLEWDLKHPIPGYSLGTADDFSVSFKLGMDLSFPNIQNEMVINQTAINADGEMVVEFNLKNIGGATANNVELSFPVGPDFGDILAKNITIYTIKDEYALAEDTVVDMTMNFTNSPLIISNFEFGIFTLDGWYEYSDVDGNPNGTKAIWDTETTKIQLLKGNVGTLVGTIAIDFWIESKEGFPTAFVTAMNEHVVNNMPSLAEVTSIDDILDPVRDNLQYVLNDTFQASFNEIYQKEDKLIFDKGDFELVNKPYAIDAANTIDMWFLEAVVDEMLPDDELTLSFAVHEVPTTADTLALMHFAKSNVNGYPHAVLTSVVQDYYEFMQYAFEAMQFDGRPISFPMANNPILDLASLNDKYGSIGMVFKYENEAGYPFFGMSNGQNIQIADDEAVISATVELDSQNYIVGASVNMVVDLTNNGDTDAENVVVHLFHASLGRDWRFERVDHITSLDVGTLASGTSASVSYDTEANTYLGYHTVFAIVEFTSDVGQAPTPLPDFLDWGITQFSAGGETDHAVMSTLSGALVLPLNFGAEPSIPEPMIELSTAISGDATIGGLDLSAGEEFTYTITIENVGDADTEVTVTQVYNTEEVEVVSVDSDLGTGASVPGQVAVESIPLAAGASTTVDINFKLKADGTTLPPVVATYTVDGDSSLGATVNTGVELNVQGTGSSSFFELSADSAAQEDSQKSGSEDSSSSAFSASSSVGAAVDTGLGGDGTDDITTGVGFIGYSIVEALALMMVPMTAIVFLKRRK